MLTECIIVVLYPFFKVWLWFLHTFTDFQDYKSSSKDVNLNVCPC